MNTDYGAMREMIFGGCPSWDEIVRGLRELETEINSRGDEKMTKVD